jgi:hypothetical protein
MAGVSKPVAFFASPTTAICTSRLSEAGWAATPAKTFLSSWGFSADTTCSTFAESAAVSLLPSSRLKTRMAPGWLCEGNSFSCTVAARIDS